MKLNKIKDNAGSRRSAMRVGRGPGSGKGKTCGSGMKGQKSRTGVALKGFEGGQMPLHRRLPKHGFTNIFAKKYQEVTIDRLQRAIDAKKIDPKKEITAEIFKESGVVRRLRDGVRLIGNGELKAKVTVHVAGATKGAVAAVEKAGGKVVVAVVARNEDAEAKAAKTAEKKAAKAAKAAGKAKAAKDSQAGEKDKAGKKKAKSEAKADSAPESKASESEVPKEKKAKPAPEAAPEASDDEGGEG
ncbi:MAG: 50S ribosomal protein L15 [Alphaproteobacteria bacterium]|nr:50S ribosomal protein L15 [Alphaproteobacteria bacterium]